MIDKYVEWSGSTAGLSGWTAVPHYERGELAAVAVMRGTEIHFAVNPAWRRRLFPRSLARKFLAPLIDERGFLTTRSVDPSFTRFLARIGFVPTWTEGIIQHYMLTGIPFAQGEKACRL